MTADPIQRSRIPKNALIAFLILIVASCVSLFLLDKAFGGLSVPSALPLMLASTAYVSIGVVRGGFKTVYGRFVLLALVFFWFGDLFGPGNFYVGALGFLLGHVTLVIAFAFQGLSRRRCLISSAVLVMAMAALLAYFLPHVAPAERAFVSAYTLVISAMVALAGGMADTPHRRLIIAAAVVFYVSDIFVAHWRFLSTTGLEPLFCYPLYYSACVMFALTPSKRINAHA